jgi:hypothetical protein
MREPDRLHYTICGHVLTGKRNPVTGRWTFEAELCPAIAREHNGDANVHEAIAAFSLVAKLRESPWQPADVI